MAWNDRSTAPFNVRDVLKQFAARNIEVPQSVNDAVAVFDRVEAATPQEPEHDAIRKAVLADADDDEINALLLADLGSTRLRAEYGQARIDATGRVLRTILRAADELHPQLRERADEGIAKLSTVADLGGASLDTLVRERRVKDAQALAELDIVATELDALYQLRDRFLTPGGGQAFSAGSGSVNAGRWRDPIAAQHYATGNTLADQFVSGLRGGPGYGSRPSTRRSPSPSRSTTSCSARPSRPPRGAAAKAACMRSTRCDDGSEATDVRVLGVWQAGRCDAIRPVPVPADATNGAAAHADPATHPGAARRA